MALATRCPSCHALFRVAADQLKLRGGLVRCGACQHVFDATGMLSYIDDAALAAPAHAPALGAVIAAIRKAEAAAGDAIDLHGTEAIGPAPDSAWSAQPPQATTQAPPSDPAAEAVEESKTPVAATETPAPEPGATEPLIEAPIEAPTEPTIEPTAPAGQGGGDGGAAGTAAAPEIAASATKPAPPPEPAFLRAAPGPRRHGRLIAAGTVLLAALALAQLAVVFRAEILARLPEARPALSQLCRVFGCTVSWPARGDLLAVVGSELQSLPGTDAFELTAVVRNRGGHTLALPALEMTLSDTLNRTVARKVFTPADYLAGEKDPDGLRSAGLEAGADLTIRIAFQAAGLNAAGFVVYPFYP